jgi:transcriptional regulator with XRE-family HTH domain
MIIGYRFKQLRESKQLSQADIEKRTGLLRNYISRVENGHTVPSIETLEKMTRAIEVPMYDFFCDAGATTSVVTKPDSTRLVIDRTSSKTGQRLFTQIIDAMNCLSEQNRRLILHIAKKLPKE